nr:TPA_asm: ND4 [Bombus convexus]
MVDVLVLMVIFLLGPMFMNKFFDRVILGNMMFLMVMNNLIKMNWISWSFILGNLGLNNYSNGMLMLVFWVFGIVLISLVEEESMFECIILNIMLMIVVLLNFLAMNLLLYYFLFESSLLIIFYIVMKWGYSENRFLASFYLMFYTLVFSLPVLYLLFQIIELNGSYMFILLDMMKLNYMSMYNYFYFIMAFLVKVPMYLVHGWLLKAHVEASYYGSMILASIMLKLGTYGVLRVIYMSSLILSKMSIYFMVISLFGMLIISCQCMVQLDMKMIIAMSSVVHMSIMLFSMLTMTGMSMVGSYYLMISHGLVSSSLFYLVNLIYSQTNSRIIFINKGLINMMPSMSMFWFLSCIYNSGAPVSLNMVSEIFLLMGLIYWCNYIFLALMLYCLLSFIYSIYLFSVVQHGKYFISMNIYIYSGSLLDYLVLILHLVPLNLMIFNLLI